MISVEKKVVCEIVISTVHLLQAYLHLGRIWQLIYLSIVKFVFSMYVAVITFPASGLNLGLGLAVDYTFTHRWTRFFIKQSLNLNVVV